MLTLFIANLCKSPNLNAVLPQNAYKMYVIWGILEYLLVSFILEDDLIIRIKNKLYKR
jgi:hypothetical protein